MGSLFVTIVISVAVFAMFTWLQRKYWLDTKRYRIKFENFFAKQKEYSTYICKEGRESYPQLELVGEESSDLDNLIREINTYLFKTKGTSDYEFIRNKVERKLNMRYDQSVVHLAFPTYLGLMGTFCGVFLGILTFLIGFDGGNVSDRSIQNLLVGVLVSMSTSLVGLGLTTWNNHKAGEARKKIEDDKDEFYDFIQTEVTKTASASLVSAIGKLHQTVDRFEPSFNTVITRFQRTFDSCTEAFGRNFEKNVVAVANAVNVMGENMDKINTNIEQQEKLLALFKTDKLIEGLKQYVEAANRFVGITQSLDKFEEARRLMLAAAQESIAIQNQYAESLKTPREVAVKISQILDRVKNFEQSINDLAPALVARNMLGNDVINIIQDQIRGISKKGKIADKYLEMSDGKLEALYKKQVNVINEMNTRYKAAIEQHIDGFENMIEEQTNELRTRHSAFIEEMQAKFNVEDVRSEFSNLKKLNEIQKQLEDLSLHIVNSKDLLANLRLIQIKLESIEKKSSRHSSNKNEKSRGVFGWLDKKNG